MIHDRVSQVSGHYPRMAKTVDRYRRFQQQLSFDVQAALGILTGEDLDNSSILPTASAKPLPG
jgi:hypothetical protein